MLDSFCEERMKFKPASREKISIQIVRQIRAAIMKGDLKPGQALPNEQDLMVQFGVSKHTLREALRALEGMGFISIKRGANGGPVVSEIDWATARDFFASFLYFQNFTAADICEVRALIEPYIVRQATEKMTPEYLQELTDVHEQCIAAFKKNKDILCHEEEVRFHVLLGKIAGNPILWVTQDFVNNMLADTKHHLKPDKEFSTQVINAHQRILEAIKSQDPDAAAQAMLEHIHEVQEGLNLLQPTSKTQS